MDEKNPDVIPCNKDSDYQLVATTPGPMTGLLTPSSYGPREPAAGAPAITRNGDLHENFKGGARYPPPRQLPAVPPRRAVAAAPASPGQSEEVTYAELSLARPSGAPVPRPLPPEPTVYAQIDHARLAGVGRPGAGMGRPGPAVSPVACPPPPLGPAPREVVTVRTPLMLGDCQQESCV